MRTRQLCLVITALLLAFASAPTAPVHATPTKDDDRAGPTDLAWQGLGDVLRQAEYHLTPHDAADAPSTIHYQAPNRAQEWRISFTQRGPQVMPHTKDAAWQWGLTLQAYGYADQMQPVAHKPILRAEANRTIYRWHEDLKEWYVNGPQGLEHGFTLTKRPPGARTSPLQVDLVIQGSLTPRLTSDGQAIDFHSRDGRLILRYDHLLVIDGAGQRLPSTLEIVPGTPPIIRIACDDAGAVYPLTIDPLITSQVAKLVASDGTTGDRLGFSTAASGDTAVVGAPSVDGSIGAAYVFARNQDGADAWGQVQQLTASDGAPGDAFGQSVAIAGDTLIVGAQGDDGNRGAAYVFLRNRDGADAWGQAVKLTAPDGESGDFFGISVAIHQDLIVIGASGDDANQGAAYVFARNHKGGDAWGYLTKLSASDGADGDNAGYSVAIDDNTVVVGALGDEAFQGAAYVFARNQSGEDAWGQVTKLTADDGTASDLLGWSVSISGDTIAAGAWGLGGNQGAAYVFKRNQDGADAWGQMQRITALDGAGDDHFGYSVALDDDVLVVGAPQNETALGAAYVFERNQGGAEAWGQVQKLTTSDGAVGDNVGYSIALDGNTAILGAWGDDAARGAAYAFSRSDGGYWRQAGHPTASPSASNGYFGTTVSISGSTIAVGAPGNDGNRGAVYVIERNQDGGDAWGQVTKLTAGGGEENDQFGFSVGIDSDFLIVGAPGDEASQGAAYVFERNRSGADDWGQVQKLYDGDGAGGDHFGFSVSIDADTATVGAYGFNSTGAVYVFERNRHGADVWERVQRIASDDAAASDGFGFSVCISNDTLLAGAPYDDDACVSDPNCNSGAAYVFERNQGGLEDWGQVRKLTPTGGAAGDYFGASVALNEDTALVGAYRVDGSTGAAYVFARNRDGADAWGQVQHLTADGGATGDGFGTSVALAGDSALVGAPYVDGNTGAAYVFARNHGGADAWGQASQLTADDGAANDWFGYSAALDGNTAVVGALYDDGGGPNAGSAYVFTRQPFQVYLPLVQDGE